MELIYLAAPYSHSDKSVVEQRMRKFLEIDGRLMDQGIKTVSPLYKHFMLPYFTGGGTWEYWKEYSEGLLQNCTKLYVIMMPGWEQSAGVQAEIEFAARAFMHTVYLDEDGNIDNEVTEKDHFAEYQTQCVIAAGR